MPKIMITKVLNELEAQCEWKAETTTELMNNPLSQEQLLAGMIDPATKAQCDKVTDWKAPTSRDLSWEGKFKWVDIRPYRFWRGTNWFFKLLGFETRKEVKTNIDFWRRNYTYGKVVEPDHGWEETTL